MKARLTLKNISANKSPKGIALVLVIFVIALATIVVVNLTYSTYLAARANLAIEKSLFAEYLLKSSINIAKSYLQADEDINADGPRDDWSLLFRQGDTVPPELLGIDSQEAINLSIELTTENRKFPIHKVLGTQNVVDPKFRDILERLFIRLGFDDDINEIQATGQLKGKHFTSQELVANLIDYMDPDSDSYQDSNFATGIESSLPPGLFPNQKPKSISELNIIPGYTPRRMRLIETYLTCSNDLTSGAIHNINFAPPVILHALSNSIDSGQIQQIIEFRESEDGPFNDTQQISDIIGSNALQDSNVMLGFRSNYFQVIGKVDLGIKSYYMRAYLYRDSNNRTINVQSIEFF